jgi:glycosyltransferase involved in cell wall biosynthesis
MPYDAPVVSLTHLVLIPSFNSGQLLMKTVDAARSVWAPVWVVIDGSRDGSDKPILERARTDAALRVLRLETNLGKGAAVRHGLMAAREAGFTHALVMDADGQHPARCITDFMRISAREPGAVVSGQPQFGPDAPWLRVQWRRISNGAAKLLTGQQVGDTLYGFRVYPIDGLLRAMERSRGMNRFDFDPEALIRLVWSRQPVIKIAAPVRYLTRAQGGISHFSYLRDNLLLARMYFRLAVAAWRGRFLT